MQLLAVHEGARGRGVQLQEAAVQAHQQAAVLQARLRAAPLCGSAPRYCSLVDIKLFRSWVLGLKTLVSTQRMRQLEGSTV